jgi:hypothetical protein
MARALPPTRSAGRRRKLRSRRCSIDSASKLDIAAL